MAALGRTTRPRPVTSVSHESIPESEKTECRKGERKAVCTHNHSVERDHCQPLGHIRLLVHRHVVHEEARSQQHPDLEVVCRRVSARTLHRGQLRALKREQRTEEEVHRALRPPSEQDEERRPPECELDAEVNRPSMREL